LENQGKQHGREGDVLPEARENLQVEKTEKKKHYYRGVIYRNTQKRTKEDPAFARYTAPGRGPENRQTRVNARGGEEKVEEEKKGIFKHRLIYRQSV